MSAYQTVTRSYDYPVGARDARHLPELSGLDFLRALQAGEIPPPSFGSTLDVEGIVELAEGLVVFRATPAAFHLNPIGTVHGGYAATLLDSCMGCAIHSALPAGMAYTTAELKVNYIRAMTPDTGPVRAEGRVIHVGRTMATSEGRLVGEADGRLYAHGSTTCLVFPAKPA